MYNYGDLHMTYVKVEITDQDVERVETLARKRDAKKVKFGAGRHGNLTDSSEQSHSYGLFGELAVAKYFNIELDNEIYDDHGDAGYDTTDPELTERQRRILEFSPSWFNEPREDKDYSSNPALTKLHPLAQLESDPSVLQADMAPPHLRLTEETQRAMSGA